MEPTERPFTPLSSAEIEELRLKEARGELTAEDCMRYIESTRAAWLSRPLPKEKKPKDSGDKPPKVDASELF